LGAGCWGVIDISRGRGREGGKDGDLRCLSALVAVSWPAEDRSSKRTSTQAGGPHASGQFTSPVSIRWQEICTRLFVHPRGLQRGEDINKNSVRDGVGLLLAVSDCRQQLCSLWADGGGWPLVLIKRVLRFLFRTSPRRHTVTAIIRSLT